jgi:hypothetical protein
MRPVPEFSGDAAEVGRSYQRNAFYQTRAS